MGLATALSSQAEKVGAANTVHAGKMKASTEKRAQGIADDLAEAKGIEDNAVAAHKLATDTENAKCAKENQAKDGEKKHLAQFVARIKSLSAHHEGPTGNDETSMATDIINMQAAIKNERADSEVDKTTCLKISLDLHTLTVSDANKHYTAEEKNFKMQTMLPLLLLKLRKKHNLMLITKENSTTKTLSEHKLQITTELSTTEKLPWKNTLPLLPLKNQSW